MAAPYYNPYASNPYIPTTTGTAAGPALPENWAPPPVDAFDNYEASFAEQNSIYTPSQAKLGAVRNPGSKGKARTTVLRKGGGEVWEDATLSEWDPAHFRLYVCDLDPALSDDVFRQTFNTPQYPSFVKAKIVREKHTNKGRGFGFVAYSDPEDFLKAWKDLNGKYIGTRPVKISKAKTGVQQVTIGAKKAHQFDMKRKRKSGTIAFSRAKIAEAEGGGLNWNENVGSKDKKSYIRR